MDVLRRANAQENLESVAGAVAVITVEFVRPEIERELAAQSDVDVIAMGQIAHVSDR